MKFRHYRYTQEVSYFIKKNVEHILGSLFSDFIITLYLGYPSPFLSSLLESDSFSFEVSIVCIFKSFLNIGVELIWWRSHEFIINLGLLAHFYTSYADGDIPFSPLSGQNIRNFLLVMLIFSTYSMVWSLPLWSGNTAANPHSTVLHGY